MSEDGTEACRDVSVNVEKLDSILDKRERNNKMEVGGWCDGVEMRKGTLPFDLTRGGSSKWLVGLMMSGIFFLLAKGGLVRSLFGDSMGLLAASEYEKLVALTLQGCESELCPVHQKKIQKLKLKTCKWQT